VRGSDGTEEKDYFHVSKARLTNIKKPWIYAVMEADGLLRWSTGFTSQVEHSPCKHKVPESPVTSLDDTFTVQQGPPDQNFKIIERHVDWMHEESSKCGLTLKNLSRRRGWSWLRTDEKKKKIDMFKFTKPHGNRICMFGSQSRRNCFSLEQNRLQHVSYRRVYAVLFRGRLQWSTGRTSQFKKPICS
jgi:hypothetical protein